MSTESDVYREYTAHGFTIRMMVSDHAANVIHHDLEDLMDLDGGYELCALWEIPSSMITSVRTNGREPRFQQMLDQLAHWTIDQVRATRGS